MPFGLGPETIAEAREPPVVADRSPSLAIHDRVGPSPTTAVDRDYSSGLKNQVSGHFPSG